ncbi:MAG: agmatine deiminase family protein [Bacteroidetes bacterium]|nr:agmatine deiminase family protein [Bacteroidota bacterium]
MKKLFALKLFLFVLTINFLYAQQPLPKGLTDQEKEIYHDFINNPPVSKSAVPPANIPRTPAEWEEAQGVIVTWAGFSEELREIVRRAKETTTVYILTSNPSNVQTYLSNGGVNMTNIVMLQPSFNSIWVRDYGPQSIYLQDGSLGIVDWLYNRPSRPDDNQIPAYIANYLGASYFELSGTSGQLIATGGNFFTDGHGTGFSSKLIQTENPSYSATQIDQLKYQYMGINRYIKMDELPYDIISHIDMHMKLLDEETLLVAKFPTGVSDGPYIENNLNYVLDNYQTCFDRNYDVVRIPMAPNSNGQYPPNSDYRTYTNALILNKIVLVPQYNHNLDETALQIYRDAMPGYDVFGINMTAVIPLAGAIHCITREIAANDPIHISHARKRFVLLEENELVFDTKVTSPSGVSSVKLFYSIDDAKTFGSVDMTLEGDTYSVVIDDVELEEGMMVHYYISATNGNSKTINKPYVAPQGFYSFEVKLVDNTSVEPTVIPTFVVYPNPSNDFINVSASNDFAGGDIFITNIQGKILYQDKLENESVDILKSINISQFPDGFYFVKIQNRNLVEVKKFIKY